MTVDRVLINTSPTISATFAVGSTPTDPSPDSATVTLLRADGTVLLTNAATGQGTGPGEFTRQLVAGTQVNKLDLLQAQWTSSFGTITTYVEVVGGFLCPLSDLKSLYPTATDAELETRRAYLEDELERALHYAAVPRYSREVHVPRRYTAYLDWPYVRALREIISDGVGYTPDAVAGTTYNYQTGQVYYLPIGARLGSQVLVAYEHGQDYPDGGIRRAMQLLAEETYGTSIGEFDSRVVRREADGQAITYASPALSGGSFSTPELNRIIKGAGRVMIR